MKASKKSLAEMPEKCISNVQQFLSISLGVTPEASLLKAVFNDPQDFWEHVGSFDKVSSRYAFGIKASSHIHHVFFARVMGFIAPHSITSKNIEDLKKTLSDEKLEEKLYSYEGVLAKAMNKSA